MPSRKPVKYNVIPSIIYYSFITLGNDLKIETNWTRVLLARIYPQLESDASETRCGVFALQLSRNACNVTYKLPCKALESVDANVRTFISANNSGNSTDAS